MSNTRGIATGGVPFALQPLWQQWREDRARLRSAIHTEVARFWVAFARRRRRIMPVCRFTDQPSTLEPAPCCSHGTPGWDDRIGFALCWRMSGVIPQMAPSGIRTLKAIWEFDWPKTRPPSRGQLISGKILAQDQQVWRESFTRINDLYLIYTGSFRAMVELVRTVQRSHVRWTEVAMRWNLPLDLLTGVGADPVPAAASGLVTGSGVSSVVDFGEKNDVRLLVRKYAANNPPGVAHAP